MRKTLGLAIEALQECVNTYNHDKKTQDKMLSAIAAANNKLAEPEPNPIGYANIEEMAWLRYPGCQGRPVFISKAPGKEIGFIDNLRRSCYYRFLNKRNP
jgi:hypothetical protein